MGGAFFLARAAHLPVRDGWLGKPLPIFSIYIYAARLFCVRTCMYAYIHVFDANGWACLRAPQNTKKLLYQVSTTRPCYKMHSK